MLYVLYVDTSWWQYVVDGINKNNIRCIKLIPQELNLLFRIIRRLLRFFKIYPVSLYYQLNYPNNTFDKCHLLFLNNANIPPILLNNISNLFGAIKSSIWLSNPCKKAFYVNNTKIIENRIEELKRLGINIYTFDKDDSIIYNISLLNQVYRFDSNSSNDSKSFDFYFLGAVKDRFEKIVLIQEKLKESNFKTHFIICTDSSQYIDYLDNINNIRKSSCIVDITQENQSGITFRPLEALSLKRKLLTDNKDIINYDFYDKNNIFIYGVDDLDSLHSFIETPFVDIDPEIIKKYDVNFWLDNFL